MFAPNFITAILFVESQIGLRTLVSLRIEISLNEGIVMITRPVKGKEVW